ncbi:MAG: malate dehydrogenase, partial [Gammaproteobacteria bacterium]
IVKDLEIDSFSRARIKETEQELKEERKAVGHLL